MRLWQGLVISALMHLFVLLLPGLHHPLDSTAFKDVPLFILDGAAEHSRMAARAGQPGGDEQKTLAESGAVEEKRPPATEEPAGREIPAEPEVAAPEPEPSQDLVDAAEIQPARPRPVPQRKTSPVRVHRVAAQPTTTLLKPETEAPAKPPKEVPPPPAGAVGGSGQAGSGEPDGVKTGIPVDAPFGSGQGPRFLRKVQPRYPPLARETGLEGVVVLQLSIDAQGRLTHVALLKSAGALLDQEAIQAVRRSTFIPARIDGRPVNCRARLPIRFSLRGLEHD